MTQREEIKALGYDEAFIRLWEFYFCYCEGGFLERTIGVVQVTAVKPDNIDGLHFSDLPAADAQDKCADAVIDKRSAPSSAAAFA